MAPKQKLVSELGTVAQHGNGWRAWVKLGCDRVVCGPTHVGRAGRREAEADLAQARQASTREEMQYCLQNLRDVPESKSTLRAEPSLEQPAAGSKVVTAKRGRSAIEGIGSGVSQSAVAKQPRSLAGRAPTSESSADVESNKNRKTLLLQLKRPHYDAMKDRRKLWEARPLFDSKGRQTVFDKLAVVGNAAVLQSGAGTNDRVYIAEVRRYIQKEGSYPLEDMVVELGADLLPDVADTRARVQLYESLYGPQCFRGFVAMRLDGFEDL